ncbi:hypothetical protein NDU88_003041, partial [Pleurodeles waltl]
MRSLRRATELSDRCAGVLEGAGRLRKSAALRLVVVSAVHHGNEKKQQSGLSAQRRILDTARRGWL